MTRSGSARISALSTKVAAALTAAVLMLALLLATPPPAIADTAPVDPAVPKTIAADGLPTVQINGVAWSQVIIGNTVYVGGEFTSARPAGSARGVNEVPRTHLLAYNLTTGALITTFNPTLNGQVLGLAASPDGTRLYAVGDFTQVNGTTFSRAVAFSVATGQTINSFKPILSTQGRAVVATADTVYLGGNFTSVSGVARNRVAAVAASNGAVLPFNANANSAVNALALTKNGAKLIVGGKYSTLGGAAARGLGAVDPTSGAVQPWAINNTIYASGESAAFVSLYADDDAVYGTAWAWGKDDGNLEGVFSANPDTGAIIWLNDCHGDTYSVYPMGDVVYSVGHAHYCGNIGGFPQPDPWVFHRATATTKAATGTVTRDPHGYYNFEGNPSPTLLNWFPNLNAGTYTGQNQGPWHITGNGQYVVQGGEFTTVNGVAQQGLVRFAVSSIAPNKIGPQSNEGLTPSVVSFRTGEARVSWQATSDRDNSDLTYKVTRNGVVVHTVVQSSNFWTRPTMGFTDTGLAPGSRHLYRVYAYDPFGNEASRTAIYVTIATADASNDYAEAVAADDPSYYWPLDEPSGTVAYDHEGFSDLTLGSGVARGAAGAVSGNAASDFDGTSSGFGTTASPSAGPSSFTVEAWINTTTDRGGKIIGFGNSATGNSGNYDRHVYMDNSGRIWFGVHPGAVRTVNSSASFNNGAWHHVAASLGANGMRLFVDGNLVGSRDDVTSAQAYDGVWRVGGDNTGGWSSQPSSNYFEGAIDEVAVYPTVLTRSDLVSHYVASGRTSPLPPAPTDNYGKAVYDNDPTLYWRLNDTTGTAVADSGPNGNPGVFSGGVTKNVAGAITGTSNRAVNFGGTSGVAGSSEQFTNPSTYSLETWFKTTTTQGGKLIGFGDQRTALSSNYDRHIYMQDDGALVFGAWTGSANTITSPTGLNNGEWHHAVGTQSSAGMALYVDGVLVGTNPATSAQEYSGYWRIGGDTTWGSSSSYFAGTLDEVAVYSTALPASTVSGHYALGATGTIPNAAPTAAFTAASSQLAVAVNAADSTDSDGTIVGYAWDFGDGATATGVGASHTYAAAGDYVITLTVTDNDGATDTETRSVTVTAPPANVAPTASFTVSSSGRTASVNGSASADSDGSIAGYAWNFGDGATATGQTASHAYAADGTYTVTLTVTDEDGATASTTRTVTVSAPPAPTGLAQDAFGRTVPSGWGSADLGGAWAVTGTASRYSVSGGVGLMTAPAGQTLKATLGAVSSSDTDLSVQFSTDKVLTGGGEYLSAIGRQVGTFDYRARVRLLATGDVVLQLVQGGTTLQSLTIPGMTHAANTPLALRLQVTGTSPTTIRAKVWPASAPEPGAWQASVTDSTAGLQTAGSIALESFISGSATNGPITTRFDNLSVTPTSTTPPPANVAPTASFTAATNGLTASVNAAASADSDGTIAGYAWNFGDGATATGVTASHAYASAGTYTVTLTVTDDDGATGVTTRSVTVTAPPAGSPLAADAFERSATAGWGTAVTGGAWTTAGGNANFSVSGGGGLLSTPAGITLKGSLLGVSSTNVDLRVAFSIDKAPTGNGAYLSAIGRQGSTSDYRARVRLLSTGDVVLQLVEGGTVLQTLTIPGITYAAGEQLQVRLQVFGTAPTTIRASVWKTGQPEPTTWQASATNAAAGLQAAGPIGLESYMAGSTTNGPIVARFDDLVVNPTP
ncbi:PKD domain-containing protein [Salinibacterium hongtaonis]|uniref:PKD domain-containing protein n=1 Tax=Homoserinimonas hongtaonis TaxID=2079791 RepID=UPI001F5400EE|nr:PKD domain-containing protein [Salinibacterium hongtaonis]